jgi:hypothetical protein
MVQALAMRDVHASQHDVVVDCGACGKERPDLVFELPTHIVIVECDEDQHKGYDRACEEPRMVNISQSYMGLPCLFVRFNPDKYVPATGRSVPLRARYDELARCIVYFTDIDRMPRALCSVVKLFYDGDDPATRTIPTILVPFEGSSAPFIASAAHAA